MVKSTPLTLIVLIYILFTSMQICSAAVPQRVAILPVSFTHSYRDADVEQVIAKALSNKFHTPLAKIVPIFEIISSKEIDSAMSGATTGKNFKLDKTLFKAIAEKTNADIVIGAEVTQLWSVRLRTWDGEVIQQTDLSIKILCYHKASEKFTEQKDYDSYNGYESLWGQPDYMADQIMYKLLNKIPDYSGLTTQQQNN